MSWIRTAVLLVAQNMRVVADRMLYKVGTDTGPAAAVVSTSIKLGQAAIQQGVFDPKELGVLIGLGKVMQERCRAHRDEMLVRHGFPCRRAWRPHHLV